MADLTLNCPGCGHKFVDLSLNESIKTMDALNAWLKAQASTVSFWCGGCSNNYLMQDDGNPSGSVVLADKSRPQIASIDVATGPEAGGTAVTITGQAFDLDPPEVYFGGVLAANIVVVNDNTVTCDSPAGTGVVDVSVSNDNGSHPTLGRLVAAFTYT